MTDVLGWAGSALLVHSLLQTRILRFRVLNLAAALALIVFNVLIAVWSMAAMNVVIAAINAWHITRLLRTRHDDRHYDVVPIGPDEAYLRLLLERHRVDIERFNPGVLAAGLPAGHGGSADDETTAVLTGAGLANADPARMDVARVASDRVAFLVLSDGETVGMVLAHHSTPEEVQLDLDYVLPRFRDFTPGEFVYRPDGPFARLGVRQVVAPPRMREADKYLARLGFHPRGNELVLDI